MRTTASRDAWDDHTLRDGDELSTTVLKGSNELAPLLPGAVDVSPVGRCAAAVETWVVGEKLKPPVCSVDAGTSDDSGSDGWVDAGSGEMVVVGTALVVSVGEFNSVVVSVSLVSVVVVSRARLVVVAVVGGAGSGLSLVVCGREDVMTTAVWVVTAGLAAPPPAPLGQRSPTKFPSRAWPNTEEDETLLSSQTAPTAACTAARPLMQLDEQLCPLVKSLVVQPGI